MMTALCDAGLTELLGKYLGVNIFMWCVQVKPSLWSTQKNSNNTTGAFFS